jgi:U3 small nucleolar RNA-associated protein 23
MRHGRAKAARKTLQYFKRTIRLIAPYHVLVDATFLVAMHQQRIFPLRQRIERVLQDAQSETKFYILKSSVEEIASLLQKLEEQKHAKAEVFRQAKDWVADNCTTLEDGEEDQEKRDKEDDDDYKKKTSVENKTVKYIRSVSQPYILASQDEFLLDKLRGMGTVPIIRLANGSVLLLENPSSKSKQQASSNEVKKWKSSLGEKEQELVRIVKEENKRPRKDLPPHLKRKVTKKAKGPNPLSCKKKRSDTPEESSAKKRRKRSSRSSENVEEN